MNQNRPRSCLGLSLGVLAAVILIPICLIAGLVGMGGYLIVSDGAADSDAVVVLSGGGADRLDQAAGLIAQGHARYLILTDTDEVADSGRRMTDYLFSEATRRGISVPQIDITDHTVTSTREEAAAVRALMEERGWTTCIVVTDPFHSRRTRYLFRRAFRGSGLEARVVPVAGHWYRSRSWFLSGEGWRVTLEEYAKLLAAWAGQ